MAKKTDTNKSLAVVLAVLIVFLGVVALVPKAKASVGDLFGRILIEVGFTDETLDLLSDLKEPSLGAFPGTSFFSDELSYNGIRHAYRQVPFSTATNTPCVLRAPSATSSLVFVSAISNEVTSTGDFILYDSQNASSFATTGGAVVAQAQFPITAASFIDISFGAATSTGEYDKFSPNSYLVFDYSAATSSLSTDTTGTCNAEFIIH